MAGEGNAVDDVRDAVVAVADAAPGSRTPDGASEGILQSPSSQVRSTPRVGRPAR